MQVRCQNPACGHVDGVHDAHGCLMLGCTCDCLILPDGFRPDYLDLLDVEDLVPEGQAA